MDEDDVIETVIEAEDSAVDPTPWHNSDTVSASFTFAAQIARAAADHFDNLSLLAMGQAAHEWAKDDKEEFIEESLTTIHNLPEGGGAHG